MSRGRGSLDFCGPYSPVPIHFNRFIDGSNKILGVSQVNEDLAVLCYDGDCCSIYVFPVKDSQGKVEYNVGDYKARFKNPEGFFFHSVRPFPDSLVILLKDASKTNGALCIWRVGSDFPEIITDEVHHFSINHGQTQRLIAVAYKRKLTIYKIGEKANDFEIFQTNNFGEEILSVTFRYPDVYILLRGYQILFNCETRSEISLSKEFKMVSDPQNIRQTPVCIYNSRTKFVLIDGNEVSEVDSDLKQTDENKREKFESVPFYNTKMSQYFMSVTRDEEDDCDYITFYNFLVNQYTAHFHCFQSAVYLSGVKQGYCSSEDDVFIIRDYNNAFQLFTQKRLDECVSKLPSLEPSVICSFFEMLWNFKSKEGYKYRNEALNLLYKPEFQGNIYDLLQVYGVFHFFKVEGDEQEVFEHDNGYIVNPIKNATQQNFETLLEKLKQLCPKEKSTIQRNFNTAIIECLIHTKKITELSNFLKTNPLYDKFTIIEYIYSFPDPTIQCYVYVQLGEAKEALEAFSKVTDPSNELLDTMVLLFKENCGDWSFIEKFGSSFIKADPIRGIEILTDEKIDITQASNYVQNNFPHLKPLFNLGAVFNPSFPGRKSMLQVLPEELCKSLTEINDKSFDISTVSYLKCVIRGGGSSPVEEIERELSDHLQKLVSSFVDEINISSLLNHINQLSSSSLKISIYLAADKFKEALDIIWESNGADPEKAALSCRECSNPQKALELLIQKMKTSLSGTDFLDSLMNLLTKNIDIIDVSYALGFLDNDSSVDTTLLFVERLYRSLLASRRDSEIEESHAISNQFEARYRRVIAESEHFSLQYDNKCCKCKKTLGFSYIVRTPDNELYHSNCAPR